MFLSTSPTPETDPVSVNVQTGIRWSVLRDGARLTAIKGQLKGGGASNPHGTTYAIAKRYLAGKLGKTAGLREARRVKDRRKRHEVRSHLKNLMRLVPHVSGIEQPLPPTRVRRGPLGQVELKVSAQLFIEDHIHQYIGFWPNHAELDQRNARLYAQLMRESVAPPDDQPTHFVIYDLKRRRSFTFDVDDLDADDSDLKNFFVTIERDIGKAKGH